MKKIDLFVYNCQVKYGDQFNNYFFDKDQCISYARDDWNHMTKSVKSKCDIWIDHHTIRIPDDYITSTADKLITDLFNGEIESPDFDVCYWFSDPTEIFDMQDIFSAE